MSDIFLDLHNPFDQVPNPLLQSLHPTRTLPHAAYLPLIMPLPLPYQIISGLVNLHLKLHLFAIKLIRFRTPLKIFFLLFYDVLRFIAINYFLNLQHALTLLHPPHYLLFFLLYHLKILPYLQSQQILDIIRFCQLQNVAKILFVL